MYSVLLVLQIFAIAFNFVCVALLLSQKSSTPAKFMLVTCICSLVQNAGYFLEMRSQSLDEAMIAVKIEYIGGAFIVTLLMIFVFQYCHVNLSRHLRIAMLLLDVTVFACVWLYEYVPLYYSGVQFVDTGVMPHLVLGKGVLYIVFSVVIYLEFISSAVVAFISFVRSKDHNMKKNYGMLFLCCTLPCLFYLGAIVNVIDGYDLAPIGGTVGILVFGFAIINGRVFDVVETAHDTLLSNLNDAIIVLDYQRGFQEANKAAIEIFPELASLQNGQLIPNDLFNSLIERKSSDDVEIDGKYYKVSVNELFASGGISSKFIGYSVAMFDITESKKQLVRMTELMEEAESANKVKASFLGNISHEVRTPINVIVGMSDIILRDYNDKELTNYAQNIQKSANTLLDLINDILDFSKIEAGHVDIINDVYRVDDFFKDIIMVFEHKGLERGLSFTTGIASRIPLMLSGDVVRLRQILTNILTNAFKYTKEGGVTLRADFENTIAGKGNLIISVEDTGIGIKREELDKVFELFVRLDERLNRAIDGTGLGLNITKKLVDLMGGEIKIYSEYGKGSVFTISIPQSIVSNENECIGEIKVVDKAIERPSVGYEASEAKILVIDDSKTNLIVAKALLRDTKVKVTTGISGEDCLKLIANEHFDVIFLDHRMPGMDGIETFRKMRTSRHKCEDTPVIMLTANAMNNAKEFYVNEGFSDFLSKPICEETITGMLKKHLPKSLIKEV